MNATETDSPCRRRRIHGQQRCVTVLSCPNGGGSGSGRRSVALYSPRASRRATGCWIILMISLAAAADGFLLEAGRVPSRGGAGKVGSAVPATAYRRSVESATPPSQNDATTSTRIALSSWSRRPGSSGGSRFGVRKRVKAVLEKARNRTGVRNNSDAAGSAGRIVADTVSIGGLADSADLTFATRGSSTTANPFSIDLSLGKDPSAVASPPSAFSSPANSTESGLVLESSMAASATERNGKSQPSVGPSPPPVDVDAVLKQPEAPPVPPLPFTLPELNPIQRGQLLQGERIQEQSKMGREGSGYVVMDIKAPPYVIWECLLDFEAYPQNIGTVRSMDLYTNTHLKQSYIAEKPVLPGTGRETRHYGTASITRAKFVLSKFKLNIAAVHKYSPHPDGHFMEFTLDRACKNVVLQDAKGIWYTESNPDGREDYTRVWLLCEVKISPLLPTFIVDYAAKRAMPRATTWLPTTVEAAVKEWLN